MSCSERARLTRLFNGLRSWRLSTRAILKWIAVFVVQLASADAHPVSHTDAWVKVSDQVNVRLNVFLDDVLLHQGYLTGGLDSPGLESISSVEVAAAVQKHSELLLKQLQIFDDQGRPLVGTVKKSAEWTDDGVRVDLLRDASLKLTWDLTYVAVSPATDLHSLVFVHDFTHETLQAPGELRLHLQLKSNGRRIDAVIPPSVPYTVVLPSASDGKSTSNVDNVNGATSTIQIGPAHITHEFTAPLLLLNSAWPDVDKFSRLSDSTVVSIDGSQVLQLEQQLQDWFQQHTQMRIDGRALAAASVNVEFLTSAMLAEAAATESPASYEELPLFGTQVSVRLLYPRGRSLKGVQLNWLRSPGQFSEATVQVVTAQGSVAELVALPQHVGDDKSALELHWAPSLNPLVSSRNAKSKESAESQLKLTSQAFVWSPRVRLVSVLFSCCASIFVVFLAVASSGFRRPVVLFTVWLFAAVVVWKVAFAETVAVNAVHLQATTQNLLKSAYLSFLEIDEQAVLSELSFALHDEFAEDVYLNVVGTLSAQDDPLLNISDVVLQTCQPLPALSTESLVTADCTWIVTGDVQHWGHSHQRTLAMSARLVVSRADDGWKIQSLSNASVAEALSENSSEITP